MRAEDIILRPILTEKGYDGIAAKKLAAIAIKMTVEMIGSRIAASFKIS